MARYFFNIFDGKEIFDETGTLLRNDNEVRLHMLALAQTWIGFERHQDEHWSLEVRDEDENLVGSMRFGVRREEGL